MACCNGHDDHTSCIECEVPQLARNNYFTGKLLVERDFTDEQRYLLGKLRRHNQRLHGKGVVCGLKVKQHPNPACQSQYVVIEPGTAIDCCGRELLVSREEFFDFRARLLDVWKQQHGEAVAFQGAPTFQICIRYTECHTEDVPALFDECGCDDTACKPNRILDGYEFDVILDPERQAHDPIGVRLQWCCTVNSARALAIALDENTPGGKLLVLSDTKAALAVFRKDNYLWLPPAPTLGDSAADLALSADGTRAYVAADQAGADPPVVLVLDTNALGTAASVLNKLPVTGPDVRLAVSPADARLYVLDTATAVVTVWDPAINLAGADLAAAKLKEITVGNAPTDLVVSPDGKFVLATNSGATTISVIDSTNLNAGPATINIPGGAPFALAVAGPSSQPKKLFVADKNNKKIHIFGIPANAADPFPALGSVTLLDDAPVDIAASPGARWIYALVEDGTGKGYVQVIDAHRVETNDPNALGAKVPVGDGPRSLVLAEDGRRLYVAFNGLLEDAQTGGVAVLDVFEEPCAELFKRSLDACPQCATGDCLVLATIEEYVLNSPITDNRIDNLADRRLLPSTELITEVVECLLEKGAGTGERGETGPPGTPGTPGTSVRSADAESVASDQDADADFDPTTGNIHFKIPKGEKGDPGEAGTSLTLDLPRICYINWPHNFAMLRQSSAYKQLSKQGLILGFTKPVMAETVHTESVQVLFRPPVGNAQTCYCNLRGQVTAITARARCGQKPDEIDLKAIGSNEATGARFLLLDAKNNTLEDWPVGEYRVLVEGDLIIGLDLIQIPDPEDLTRPKEVNPALDADHLAPGLPWLGSTEYMSPIFPAPAEVRPRCPTGNGTEGGTFISWFTIVRE
jgi:DNA-binding beta-propeller fold protein YncE